MPKISEEQRQVRRDQILAAAWRCFARRGIHATSMEEIIREADLSAGAVYLYYKGKDELILAAISVYMGQLGKLLFPLLMQDEAFPPAVLVKKVAGAIATHTKRNGIDLNAIILMCWSEAQSNATVKALIAEFQLNYRAALTALVRRWQRSGELSPEGKPADMAKAMHSYFLGLIVQSALVGGVDAETAARGFAGLIAAR